MTLYLVGNDAGSKKIVTPDDSTVELSGAVLQVKDGGITFAKLDADIFDGASDATVDVANDEIIILDNDDNGDTKTESISDLMDGVADGVTIEASSGVLSVKSGVYIANPSYTAGEGLAKGDAVYIKSDGKAWKAKADAAATMPCVGFAAAAAEAEAAVSIIGPGQIMADVQGGGALTVGGKCWVSAGTAGQVTQTAPVGSANVQQCVGYMKDADDLHVIIGEGVLYPTA